MCELLRGLARDADDHLPQSVASLQVYRVVVPQTLEPEDLIRGYLKTLDDPATLVDNDTVARLEDAVRSATDPIDKLRALAALNKAKTPDVDFYRAGFVQHARAWAEANDIPLETFADVGVSRDVLRSAGLVGGRSRTNVKASVSRKSVSAREIENEVCRLEGVFTLADVARDIGCLLYTSPSPRD